MTQNEIELFAYHLLGRGKYLEWGSGDKSFWASQYVQRVYTIDISQLLCAEMRKQDRIRCLQEDQRLTYFCPQTGYTLRDGFPLDQGQAHLFHRYVNAIDFIISPEELIDVVMVDGRYRVACALKALPYLIESNGVLMLHDANRSSYRPIAKFYDTINSSDRLRVLKPKRELQRDAFSAYVHFLGDPS